MFRSHCCDSFAQLSKLKNRRSEDDDGRRENKVQIVLEVKKLFDVSIFNFERILNGIENWNLADMREQRNVRVNAIIKSTFLDVRRNLSAEMDGGEHLNYHASRCKVVESTSMRTVHLMDFLLFANSLAFFLANFLPIFRRRFTSGG